MPLFPLASGVMTFLLGSVQKSKFVTYICRRFTFYTFFAFPFSPSFICLLQWLTFYWACFQFKNFRESITEMGNLCHRVAKCSRMEFCSEFSSQISEHFCVDLGLYWANHSHWKDLFCLQNPCIDEANFGQRWWCQKWNKGQCLSWTVTASMGWG